MIGTILVLTHLIFRRLGLTPVTQAGGCDSICMTHEGGARPPGTPGGPSRSTRQIGGTDEPPTSASGRSSAESKTTLNHSEGPCKLGLGTTAAIGQHEANAVTAFDFRPLIDSSEAIPLIGFDFETIVDPRSTSLADIGSAECEYLDEDTLGQELCPISILNRGGGGGVLFYDTQPISNIDDNRPVLETSLVNIKATVQEAVESEDLPASGDGTKTPVDGLLNQEQGKVELPSSGLDEVIAAILGLDEVKVGDSDRTQGIKSELSNPMEEALEKVKTCMKNAVSIGEPEVMSGGNAGEGRIPNQESTCSDQDNLLFLDNCNQKAF